MKDDTISRAAAIDAMMKLQTEDIEAYGASIPEGFDGDRAVTAIKALPSAQLAQDLTKGCTDTISRQAVLNLIEQSCCDLEYDCDNVALRKEVEALPSAQPGWIPVTERLPKPNEYENDVRKYYLVQNEHGDMMVCSWHGGFWMQMYRNTHVEDKVVAWMPLPTPYREGGHDNGLD